MNSFSYQFEVRLSGHETKVTNNSGSCLICVAYAKRVRDHKINLFVVVDLIHKATISRLIMPK